MPLVEEYQWLLSEPGPIMVIKALELYDIMEEPGTSNNPIILSWAKEVGQNVAHVYKADKIPWCGLFMAVVAKRSSNQIVKDPLWALNWGAFGEYSEVPMLGDVLVFVRETSDGKKAGHVGLYIGEDATCFHVLGGNQSDKVCIARKQKDRLYIARRPTDSIQSENVRKIILAPSGSISDDEE